MSEGNEPPTERTAGNGLVPLAVAKCHEPCGTKKFEKTFQKPLTFAQKCDRMNMKRGEGKPPQTRKGFTMKKATMNTIVNYINDNAVEALYEVRDELITELNKGAEEKARNAELYDSAKEVVMGELSMASEAVTLGELYDAVADNLPEGFTKGKLQYAVTRLWKDEIVRIEGKVNTYRKA